MRGHESPCSHDDHGGGGWLSRNGGYRSTQIRIRR